MRRYLSLVVEEVRRELILARRYWMNQLSVALTVYLFFMLVVFMGGAMSGQAVSPEAKAGALVGMLVWQLSMGSMGVLGWSFSNEAAFGTLEHLYLSPLGISPIFLARSVANFISSLVLMLVSGALAVVTMSIHIALPPVALAVILPLAVAGTYGFGFMLAALTLTFKRTQQLMNLSQFFFLFFTGAMIPLAQMHWALRLFGQTLPVTAGITALREVTINHASLSDVSGYLLQMVITSTVWLTVGLLIYKLADRRARLRGSIGQY